MGSELPARVKEALGELAGTAREGLMALSVGVGLGVLSELMGRGGRGGRRAEGKARPRAERSPPRARVQRDDPRRAAFGGRAPAGAQHRRAGETALSTYAHFADRDPLSRVVMKRMLAGTSTRRSPRTQEPVGEEAEAGARSTSKSPDQAGRCRRARDRP